MCCCHEGHGCHGSNHHDTESHGHHGHGGCCHGEHGNEVSREDKIEMLSRQVSFMKERLERLERELAGLSGTEKQRECECEKG